MSAKVIEVIETALRKCGLGVAPSPVHIVTQYWSRDGELLAERDGRLNQAVHEACQVAGEPADCPAMAIRRLIEVYRKAARETFRDAAKVQ